LAQHNEEDLVAFTFQRERESVCVYLPQNNQKTYKIILNISTVASYQIGKPIKLVAYIHVVLIILNLNIECNNRTNKQC